MVKLFCSNYWQNPQITAAVHYSQKQFCKKMYSVKVRKYHRKIPVLESVFNKVAGLRAYNFIAKKLQHRCFPVKFAKIFRIPILKNICEQLLLYLHYNSSSISLSSLSLPPGVAIRRCSTKLVFLKIWQISQENTCFGVSF